MKLALDGTFNASLSLINLFPPAVGQTSNQWSKVDTILYCHLI